MNINKGLMIGAGVGGSTALGIYLVRRRTLLNQLDECPDEECRLEINNRLSDLKMDAIKLGAGLTIPAAFLGSAISKSSGESTTPIDPVVGGAVDASVEPTSDNESHGVRNTLLGGGALALGGKVGYDYTKIKGNVDNAIKKFTDGNELNKYIKKRAEVEPIDIKTPTGPLKDRSGAIRANIAASPRKFKMLGAAFGKQGTDVVALFKKLIGRGKS